VPAITEKEVIDEMLNKTIIIETIITSKEVRT